MGLIINETISYVELTTKRIYKQFSDFINFKINFIVYMLLCIFLMTLMFMTICSIKD